MLVLGHRVWVEILRREFEGGSRGSFGEIRFRGGPVRRMTGGDMGIRETSMANPTLG